MKAIIFGGRGQDAYYLSTKLAMKDIKVLALGHTQMPVQNAMTMTQLIRDEQPDYIFHFAAQSSTKHNALFANQQAIVDGTINILEAVYNHSKHTKVYLAGSILQLSGNDVCVDSPKNNSSAYAAQRNASFAMGEYYRTLGVKVYMGYFSYHDSPLRSEHHLAQRIAATVRRIMDGSETILELKDPQDEKEWNFAGDIMDAVLMQIEAPTISTTVIGSGVTHSIMSYAEACFDAAGITPRIMVDMTHPHYRSSIRTDDGYLFSLGWKPRVNMKQLADMMVTTQPFI